MDRYKTARELIEQNLSDIDSLIASIQRDLEAYRKGERCDYATAGDLEYVRRQLFDLLMFVGGH